MITEATLGFLFKENGKIIILAKKKRKIGVGKLNGYGGKFEEGENKDTCMVRELAGESGVIVEKEDCKYLGEMTFHNEGKKGMIMRVYMYRIHAYFGEPKETEEMGPPHEFDISTIPYDEMMLGDDKFMPFILEGKKFTGEMYYSADGKEIIKFFVNEIIDEKMSEIKMK